MDFMDEIANLPLEMQAKLMRAGAKRDSPARRE
jgi:transcriptional regulator with PAS, ATPase and Fis domain